MTIHARREPMNSSKWLETHTEDPLGFLVSLMSKIWPGEVMGSDK